MKKVADSWGDSLTSPRFVNALATAAIGTAVLSTSIQRTIGAPGLIAIVVILVLLAALSLALVRRELRWLTLVPISIVVFLGWAGLSIVWSQYQWTTLWGLLYLFAFSILGLYVAVLRDTIQIVRAFGDVLRVALVASLVLEIFSGLLVDSPIRFLGIQGNLDQFGPAQGLMGTRNQFALIALVAIVTFVAERRTKSVGLWLSVGSLALAGLALLLSRSPVMFALFVITAAAAAALYGIRRVPESRRTFWQLVLLMGVVIGLGIAWSVRSRVVELVNTSGDLDYRLDLWRRIWAIVGLHPLEGWGWSGYWHTGLQPFTAFATPQTRVPTSALNAFVDVWLQLGLVGVAIFVGLVGLTFVRSWLLAGQRRSFVFAWPALILIVLIVSSLAESSMLVEWGWLTFVVCSVKAASELSWRRAFARPLPLEESN